MGNNNIVKPLPDGREAAESLGVRILAAIGGFMAMLFLLLFLLVCDAFDSPIVLIVTGIVFIVCAILESFYVNNLMFRTAGIMFYLAGYVLLGIGLLDELSFWALTWVLAILSLLTLVVLRKGGLVFFTVLFFWGSSLAAIWKHGQGAVWLLIILQALALVYIYLYKSRFKELLRVPDAGYPAFRNGMLISFLIALLVGVYYPRWEFEPSHDLSLGAATVLLIGLVLLVFFRMLRVMDGGVALKNSLLWRYGGCCVVALVPLLFFPSSIGMLLVILLCFFTRHRIGLVLGVLGLIEVMGQLYYDLNMTLLLKSLFLVGSGILFLLLFGIVNRQLKRYGKI